MKGPGEVWFRLHHGFWPTDPIGWEMYPVEPGVIEAQGGPNMDIWLHGPTCGDVVDQAMALFPGVQHSPLVSNSLGCWGARHLCPEHNVEAAAR